MSCCAVENCGDDTFDTCDIDRADDEDDNCESAWLSGPGETAEVAAEGGAVEDEDADVEADVSDDADYITHIHIVTITCISLSIYRSIYLSIDLWISLSSIIARV